MPGNSTFFAAYEHLLDHWPVEADRLDVPTEFGTTRVNLCGPDDAPAVVLLPGGGASSAVWRDNVAALSEGHRVYAVDILGDAGRSVPDGRPLRTGDDLVTWLDTLADHEVLDDFHLVGHSYGAMIALAYALARPQRLHRMVLLDPNLCFAGMRAGYLARAAPQMVRPTARRQRALIKWETRSRLLDESALRVLTEGPAHFPPTRLAVPKRPARDVLEHLSVDTTVVLAGRSRVHDAQKTAQAVERLGAPLRVTTVPDATHHTMPMYPSAEVNSAIIAGL